MKESDISFMVDKHTYDPNDQAFAATYNMRGSYMHNCYMVVTSIASCIIGFTYKY